MVREHVLISRKLIRLLIGVLAVTGRHGELYQPMRAVTKTELCQAMFLQQSAIVGMAGGRVQRSEELTCAGRFVASRHRPMNFRNAISPQCLVSKVGYTWVSGLDGRCASSGSDDGGAQLRRRS